MAESLKYGEAVKEWKAVLNGEVHRFRIEHQFWTGEKKYYIDDELFRHVAGGIAESARFSGNVPFSIGGHRGEFRLKAVGLVAYYDLYIDGNKVEGKERMAPRIPPWAMFLLFFLLILLAWLSIKN